MATGTDTGTKGMASNFLAKALEKLAKGDEIKQKHDDGKKEIDDAKQMFINLMQNAYTRKAPLAPENPYTPEITPVNPIVNAGMPPKEIAPRPFGVTLPNAPFATQGEADNDLLQQNIDQIRKEASARQLGDTQNITTNTLGTGLVKQNVEEVPGRASIFGATEALLPKSKELAIDPTKLTFEQRLALKQTNPTKLSEDELESNARAIEKNPNMFYSLSATARTQMIPYLEKRLIKVVPKEQIKSANDAEISAVNATNAINLITGKIERIIGADTAPGAWVQGAGNTLGSFFKTDADAAVYNSTVKGMIPMVARAIGHTGVLTQLDVDSVAGLFPTFYDTVEIAKRKIENIENLISKNRDERLRVFTAVRPSVSLKENKTTETKPKADPLGLFK